MIFRIELCPNLRKCQPLSIKFASFDAMISVFTFGFFSSITSMMGLSISNFSFRSSVKLAISLPPLPIMSPGLSTVSTIRVPIKVRCISAPPKPAFLTLFRRYSLMSCLFMPSLIKFLSIVILQSPP